MSRIVATSCSSFVLSKTTLRWQAAHAALLGLLLAAYLAGIWFIDVTGKALGDPDHGSIVWDEIVPFWLVLLMTPDTFLWQLTAFALFRYFDITKPQPARYFDEHVKNGFGVMADDLVAAGYTLLALALLKVVLA